MKADLTPKTEQQKLQSQLIPVCKCCNEPLIWTFIFPGSEYFCRECKTTFGMFGNYDLVKKTPGLLKRKEENDKWFNEIANPILPPGCYLSECEQCKNEPHRNHATKKEIKASDDAFKKLMNYIGGKK